MNETDEEPSGAVQRLCSEIQLFDLCDRETCSFKEGRFCTNQDLVDRFERISEDDRRPAVRSFPAGEGAGDEGEAECDDADDYGVAELDDEGDDWEDG